MFFIQMHIRVLIQIKSLSKERPSRDAAASLSLSTTPSETGTALT